jgi:hypothetical protein
MVLDVIATRYIKPDEEIFIDYGTPEVLSGGDLVWTQDVSYFLKLLLL